MKKIIAVVCSLLFASSVMACPSMINYGCCTCGQCNQYHQTSYEDLTGYGYYDSQGHYCEYSGYWSDGVWIQTVGYYINGEWYPAEYDPALETGYYDENGHYYSYSYNYESCGYNYNESTTWACDSREWLENQNDYYDYYYDECDYNYDDNEDNYWINVDLDADVIQLINNGIVIFSGTCTCASIYRGQTFDFNNQKCSGIWNTCSSGFYEEACNYMDCNCQVRCW